MVTIVTRKYRCAFGHEWKDHAAIKGSPPPAECPECQAIVEDAAAPPARSDVVGAPEIRGSRTKAVARFEQVFQRPHFDDGKPMLTNLRDNVRPGESYAVPETVSTSETMRMTKEMIEQAASVKQQGRNTEGAHLMAIGGGWQGASADILSRTAGHGAAIGRPTVDLQTKRTK